jgi:hypothetical protein
MARHVSGPFVRIEQVIIKLREVEKLQAEGVMEPHTTAIAGLKCQAAV